MWVLEHCKPNGVRFQLLPERDYTIGRKGCTINVEGDGSISRTHANLRVSTGNGAKNGCVVVTDKSKFGTFVNERKLEAGKPFELTDGCMLMFGAQQSTFRLKNEPFVVCFSTIGGETKKELTSIVKKIGGHCEPSWSASCTCLVMNTITLTVKVVTALAACRPIVTPQWLKEVLKAAEEAQPLPSCSNFLPLVGDKSIRDVNIFHPRQERASLFAGKSFVFLLKKDYTDLRQVVTLAGGQCRLSEEPLATGQMKQLVNDGTVVILDSAARMKTKWTQQVAAYLEQHGRRCVHPSEAGFAIMSSNVTEYTNAVAHNPLHSQSSVSMVASQAVPSSLSVQPSLSSQQVQSSAPVQAALPAKLSNKSSASTSNSFATEKKETETTGRGHEPKTPEEEVQPQAEEKRPPRQRLPEPSLEVNEGEKTDLLRNSTTVSEVLASPSPPQTASRLSRAQRSHGSEMCIGETELSRPLESQVMSVVPSSQPESELDDERQPIAAAPLMVRPVKRVQQGSETAGVGSPAKRTRRLSPVRAVRSRLIQNQPEDNQEEKKTQRITVEESPPGNDHAAADENHVDSPMAHKHVSMTQLNGGSGRTEQHSAKIDVDDNLPRDLVRLETVDLCCKRREVEPAVEPKTSVNFKKFRKVRGRVSGARRGIPCIIGGDQLTVHVNNSGRELEEFLMQEREANAEMHQQDEYGEKLFRMDPPRSSRQARR